MLELVLASNSPRRRELLQVLGFPFIVQPASADETPIPDESPKAYVQRVSLLKAGEIARRMPEAEVIIAADTVVVDGTQLLGKPSTKEEASTMLRQLRNRQHSVLSSIVVYNHSKSTSRCDLCESRVTMRDYSEAELTAYVESGDPMDKAGAYAVQNRMFHPVTGFGGCIASVMGFPLCHLTRTLRQMGIEPSADVPAGCQSLIEYQCPIHQRVLAGEDIG